MVPAKYVRLPATPEFEKNRTYIVTTYMVTFWTIAISGIKTIKTNNKSLIINPGGAVHDDAQDGRR